MAAQAKELREKLTEPTWGTVTTKKAQVHQARWRNVRGYNITAQLRWLKDYRQWQGLAYDKDDGTIIVPGALFFVLETGKEYLEEEVLAWVASRPVKRIVDPAFLRPGQHLGRRSIASR